MYQKMIIVGNLGRDPEMRYTPGGQAVTNMSVATNRRYNDSNGQRVDETTWFRVSVWGNQAEAVNQYLQQGSRVLVEGRLNPDPETGGPRIWTRNDGTPGASFEITAWRVVFLSSREEDQAYQSSQSSPGGSGQSVEEDDIPF
jgi:single-strand DNA-binding protein